MMTMKVTPIASTVACNTPLLERDPFKVTDADHLSEFAGRACYKSWSRPNPATAENADYLAHIVDSAHLSVLEHASVTFYVEHVSRSLLLELERHRFLSFSVESQRYVDQASSHPEPVIPPGMRGNPRFVEALQRQYTDELIMYRDAVQDGMTNMGMSRKEARQAARAFLPNATPVDFVVTGNLRCWRDVLGKRLAPAADAEIREFAQEVLSHLSIIAPHSVADLTVEA